LSESSLLPPFYEDSLNVRDVNKESEKSDEVHISRQKFAIALGMSAVLGAVLVFAVLFLTGNSSFSSAQSNEVNPLAGEVALTEAELAKLISDAQVSAYWIGPEANAKYALTITADNQVFVKYLPNGVGLGDLAPKYRVIATYPEAAAYDITRAAGTQATAVAFINADGAAIYYSKNRDTNVYVAYSGIPFEIEIFDPKSESALELATTPGAIKKIE
jgi:hypothetical protein